MTIHEKRNSSKSCLQPLDFNIKEYTYGNLANLRILEYQNNLIANISTGLNKKKIDRISFLKDLRINLDTTYTTYRIFPTSPSKRSNEESWSTLVKRLLQLRLPGVKRFEKMSIGGEAC